MKRPKLAAAIFALAAGAVWAAEALWLRRARDPEGRPAEEAEPQADAPRPVVSAQDARFTP
jgi:hypothetical protein